MVRKAAKTDYTIEPKLAYWTTRGFRAGFDTPEEALLQLVGETAASRVVQARNNQIAGLDFGAVSAAVTSCMTEIVKCLEEAGYFVIPPPRKPID